MKNKLKAIGLRLSWFEWRDPGVPFVVKNIAKIINSKKFGFSTIPAFESVPNFFRAKVARRLWAKTYSMDYRKGGLIAPMVDKKAMRMQIRRF